MEQDDDVLTALARELVTQKGIGECAAAVWRTLNQQRTQSGNTPLIREEATEFAKLPDLFSPEVREQAAIASAASVQLAFSF